MFFIKTTDSFDIIIIKSHSLIVEYIEGVLSALEYMSQDKDNKPVCTYLSAHYKIAKGNVMEVCPWVWSYVAMATPCILASLTL